MCNLCEFLFTLSAPLLHSAKISEYSTVLVQCTCDTDREMTDKIRNYDKIVEQCYYVTKYRLCLLCSVTQK